MYLKATLIIVIFIISLIAWQILSSVMKNRSYVKDQYGYKTVGMLWGNEHLQTSPTGVMKWNKTSKRKMTKSEKRNYINKKQYEADMDAYRAGKKIRKVKIQQDELYIILENEHRENISLESSDIQVDLDLDHRKKGLLWYSTYNVNFNAIYKIINPVNEKVKGIINFSFPSSYAVYDNMKLKLKNGDNIKYETKNGILTGYFDMSANSTNFITFQYKSRGLNTWTYKFSDTIQMVKKFKLIMNTNFNKIDFPKETISPDIKTKNSNGWTLTWAKESIVSKLQVGMEMPHRINPGPFAAAMSNSAPISLLFFFFVMFVFQILKNIRMHPVNYFFLAASFFSFNLLFSYLVDHISITLAFLISAVVSFFLVISYLIRVTSVRFAVLYAGLSQFIFQFLFSYAHFFKGFTGLTITIGAICTLGIIMWMTAHLDWSSIFDKNKGSQLYDEI